MIKKVYTIPLLLLAVCFSVTSCLNNNNDDDDDIDQEWKTLNDTRFNQVAGDASYNVLLSQSGNGSVYWKRSSAITDSDTDELTRITIDAQPEFTDTVVLRYEGWYFDKEGEKIIFESTENPSLSSRINYNNGAPSIYPNKKSVTFAMNPNTTSSFTVTGKEYVGNIIDGWVTLLQDMKTGDEREVCIPYVLGRGASLIPYVPTSSSFASLSYSVGPAYTTLWYRIKLVRIIPIKGTAS